MTLDTKIGIDTPAIESDQAVVAETDTKKRISEENFADTITTSEAHVLGALDGLINLYAIAAAKIDGADSPADRLSRFGKQVFDAFLKHGIDLSK